MPPSDITEPSPMDFPFLRKDCAKRMATSAAGLAQSMPDSPSDIVNSSNSNS